MTRNNEGKKPVVWDEVKYEGNNTQNWGTLSAPQMVQRFWWAAAVGAYGGHGEVSSVYSYVSFLSFFLFSFFFLGGENDI